MKSIFVLFVFAFCLSLPVYADLGPPDVGIEQTEFVASTTIDNSITTDEMEILYFNQVGILTSTIKLNDVVFNEEYRVLAVVTIFIFDNYYKSHTNHSGLSSGGLPGRRC